MIKLHTHTRRGRKLLSKIVPTVITCLAMILMFGTNANAQTYLSESFEGAWYVNGNNANPGTATGPNAPDGWNQIRVVGTGNPTNLCGSGNSSVDWGAMSYSGGTYSSSTPGLIGCAYGNNSQPLSAPIAGSKVLWFYEYWALSGSTRLLSTPTVDLSASTTPVVSFSLVNSSTAVLRIMGSLDGGTTWNDLGAVPNTATGTWGTRIVAIPTAYKIATAKFGIQVVSAYSSGDVTIDNFQIKEGIAPASPTTFATNTITGTSFNVTWVDNSTNETSFRVYRSTDNVNFTLINTTTSTTSAAIGGTPYTLAQTGLTPGTTYYYQITSVFEAESPALTGSQALAAGTTYTWNQTVSGAYSTATNWTPTRTTPSTSDVLIFDGALTPSATVTGFATQSIGQLIVKNNATVLFSSPATATLTLIGGAGKDFDIQAGSTFRLNAGFALGMAFSGTGHEGNIAGTFDVANTVATTINFTNSIDTVTSTGILRASGTASQTFTAGTAILYIAGTYNNANTTVAGTVPTATWLTGSNCLISGYTTNTTALTGIAQTFYNFTWNCPSQTGNYSQASSSVTGVTNEFKVISTGTGQLRWATTGSYTLNIKDYIQTGGNFDLATGASGTASFNVSGSFNQSAGTFLSSGTSTCNPTLNFNGALGNQAVTFATQPTGPITYRVSNGNGITLTGPNATFALGNGTLGGLRISTKATAPVTFAGTSTSFAYNAANSTLTYDTAASFSMRAIEFPATAGPARLTVNVGAANTIAMPFSRSLSQTTANSILSMVSGVIDLGTTSSTLTLGATAAFPGTLTYTAGGFNSGSTLTRYWPTTTGGASITASTTTTNATSAGLYPFVTGTSPAFKNRTMFLNQTTAATTAGTISVKFNDVAGLTPVTITDGAYTISNLSNSNWVVTNTAVGSAYAMAISAQDLYPSTNGNSRISLAAAPAAGTNQLGTQFVNAQRITIPAASLSNTYYMGVSSLDLPNNTITSGSFDDPAIWSKGTVPTCGSVALISSTDSVWLNSGSVTAGSLVNNGALMINGGTLTLGCNNNDSLFNVGRLYVTNGDLNMNGRINSPVGSRFTQTNGNIVINGNSGSAGTSVATGFPLLQIGTNLLTLTGGTLKFVNGHIGNATSDVAINYTSSTSPYPLITVPHTVEFGNGTSTLANGSRGYEIITGTRFYFGNLIVNTPATANNFVQSSTATCVINGDLTITKGAYRTPTTGQIIGGNIINNDTLTSIGTITFGKVLQANMSSPTISPDSIAQTVGGTGVFKNLNTAATANFTNLTFNNVHPSGVSFLNANSLNSNSYGGTMSGALTLTAGLVNTGSNTLTVGISGTSTGSTTYVSGGFSQGSTLERWWGVATGAAGAAITTGNTPSTTGGGFYPFIHVIGAPAYLNLANVTSSRNFYLRQETANTTAGKIAVKLNSSATGITSTTITDGAYTATNLSNANWTVTNTGFTGANFTAAANGQNIYAAGNGNSILCLNGAVAPGVHQTGTSYVSAQRTAIPPASLTNTYYTAIADDDFPNLTVAAGAWEDPAIWSKGTVPSCTDSVIVLHTVDINATGNVAKSIAIIAGGTLNSLTGSDLTVSSCTSGVNTSSFRIEAGTYNNSGGDLLVNGRFALGANVASTFIQSAGNITIDPNSGTLATSVLGHSVDMYCHTTSTLQLTGGNFTVVDPTASTSSGDHSFKIYPSTSISHGSGVNWNLKFGNGLSNDAGGHTSGFLVSLVQGSTVFRINGTLVVDMLGGTNRHIQTAGNIAMDNLTITSGDYRAASVHYFRGNVVNNGTMTSTSTTYFADFNGSTQTAGTVAQTISGSGVFRNNATPASVTGTHSSFYVNNTAGVTLGVPVSVSVTLGLTAGRLNTDNTNIVRVGNTITPTAGGIAYTAATGTYVNGPMERVFLASRTATGTYSTTTLFPVGCNDTTRVFYFDPSTNAGGPIVVKVTPTCANTGTAGGGVSNMGNIVWSTNIVSGSANFTGSFVSLGDYSPMLDLNKKILYSATASGAYNGTPGGSTFLAGTPNTLRTAALISSASYLNNLTYGDLSPCLAPTDQATLTSSLLTSGGFTGTITPATSLPTGYLVVRYPVGTTPVNPTDGVSYAAASAALTGGTVINNYVTTTPLNFTETGLTASTSYDYYVYSYNNSGCAGPTYNTTAPTLLNITTCAAAIGTPGTPVVSAQTSTGMTLTWTASSTPLVDYKLQISTNNTFTAIIPGFNNVSIGTGLTTNVTGLTPGTLYYARIYAELTGCVSPFSGIVGGYAPCNGAAFTPYYESFETGTGATLPPCWGFASQATTTPTLGTSAGNFRHQIAPAGTFNQFANTGTSYISYNWNASASYKYFTAPPVNLTSGTSYRIKVNYVTDGQSPWDTLKICYSTSPIPLTSVPTGSMTTVPGAQVLMPTNQTYQLLQGDLIPSTTGTYYFAIACYNSTTVPDFLSLDDYGIELTPACAGLPTVGTASIGLNQACGNVNNTTLTSPTGSYSTGTGIVYQWQTSNDNFVSNIVDISGANNPLSANTGTFSVGMNYYRLKVSCTNSGLDAYSNIVTVNYSNPGISTTTPGTRCGSGTVALSATAPVSNTVVWYAGLTGGSALAVGNNFTTPTIATTTSYYVTSYEPLPNMNVAVGTGTATSTGIGFTPFYGGYGGSKNQWLILASELSNAGIAAGPINSISFDLTTASSTIYQDFAIAIGTTTQTALTTTPVSGLTDVYTHPTNSQTTTVGINTFTFNTPFVWDGVSNIVVQNCYSNNNVSNPASSAKYSATSFVAANTIYSDNQSSATICGATGAIPSPANGSSTTTSNRPNMIFNSVGKCEGTRTAVVATVTAPPALTLDSTSTTICNGSTSTTINVTSNLPDYSTYTWAPATGVSNVNGTSVTFNPTANTTYTLSAANSGGATCATSVTFPVTVKILPIVNASVTTASICEGSSTTINAAGGASGTYCTPTVSNAGVTDDYLENFTMGTISNLVSGDAATDYTYYSAMSTNLVADGTTLHPLTFDFGGTSFLQTLRVFIDLDQNGTFDASESMFNTTTATTNGTGNITIPNTALNGTTRMRVLTKYNSASLATEACALTGYGEYEDYNVVISGGTNAGTYAWNPGSLAGASQLVSPAATTVYTVTATSGNGCTATSSVNVDVKIKATLTVLDTICTTAFPYSWNGQTITAVGTYSHTQTGANGCDSITTLNLASKSCSATLNLTAFIQGYYGGLNSVAGEMAPVLNNSELAGASTIVGSTLTQCDTITVELHDATTYAVSYSFTGILNTNGTLTCTFPGASVGGSYYIALRHRNALETWSANPITIASTQSYNFSTAATQAYGDNMIEVATGVFAIYSGDMDIVNSPGSIDPFDYSMYEADYNNFGAGYMITDLNGDGSVDPFDYSIYEANYNNFIGTAKP